MPSDRKPSLILMVAGAILLALLVYVGTYYATVEPVVSVRRYAGGSVLRRKVPSWGVDAIDFDPGMYEAVTRFFAPIHRVDRSIRPSVWEMK